MHELWMYKDKNTIINLTPIVGNISWRSSIEELGQQLNFDIAFNDDKYFPINPLDLGKMVFLKDENEILRTFVVTENRNGRGPIQYTCFDAAFYLNKSKITIQFNGIAGNEAIESLLKRFNIPVGCITPIKIKVKKIYKEKIVSDILKDILDQAEKELNIKYRMEMRVGKLYIEEEKIIQATFKLAENIAPENILAAIGNASKSRSIADMRNFITITTGNEKSVKVVAEEKNDELINLYGRLEETKNIAKKDIAQAKNIASNMLKELGKVFEENSIEVPGNDNVRSGRILELYEPVTKMSGKYLIKSCNHTIRNDIHRMQLSLKGVK